MSISIKTIRPSFWLLLLPFWLFLYKSIAGIDSVESWSDEVVVDSIKSWSDEAVVDSIGSWSDVAVVDSIDFWSDEVVVDSIGSWSDVAVVDFILVVVVLHSGHEEHCVRAHLFDQDLLS